jgi:16S rRNA (uracil1498-N3)-methyltransferase
MLNKHSIRTRLYVDPALTVGATVALSDAQFHQLKTVQRLNSGDFLALFDGVGGEFLAELHLEKKSATASIRQLLRPLQAPPELTLFFAPVKSARLDFMIEKATELGATRLCPILTERTQAERVNTRRLRETAREAAEQCERMDVPAVEEPQKLASLLAAWDSSRRLYVCAESGDAMPMQDVVVAGPGAILIGPEGGFSPAEFTALRALSFVEPVSLGPRILRAETATIAALTCWQIAAGHWQKRG